jgi:hypothetical protein
MDMRGRLSVSTAAASFKAGEVSNADKTTAVVNTAFEVQLWNGKLSL